MAEEEMALLDELIAARAEGIGTAVSGLLGSLVSALSGTWRFDPTGDVIIVLNYKIVYEYYRIISS